MDKSLLTGIIADRTDEKLKIMCSDQEENTFTLSVPLMGYEETKHKYVDDPEVVKRAEETLAELGLTLDDVEEKIMDGHQFEAYTDLESARASVRPIQKFIRFKQIKTPDAKILEKNEGAEIVSLPISDFKGFRFNLGFEAETRDGQKVNYRISSLRLVHDDDETPDTFVSLKYITKDAEGFNELLKNNTSLSEEKKQDIRKRIEKFNMLSRAAKVDEIKEAFGLDFDELMENESRIKLRYKVLMIPNSENFYLAAEVLGVEDAEEAPAPKKAKK